MSPLEGLLLFADDIYVPQKHGATHPKGWVVFPFHWGWRHSQKQSWCYPVHTLKQPAKGPCQTHPGRAGADRGGGFWGNHWLHSGKDRARNRLLCSAAVAEAFLSCFCGQSGRFRATYRKSASRLASLPGTPQSLGAWPVMHGLHAGLF